MSDGSGVIDVGSNSAPVVVDWNGDGVLDLLVGNEDSSQGIRLYINTGTATNPVLDTWTWIYSNGSSINWYRCVPAVYDMNGDGNKDLIVGESSGKFYYYENQDSNDSPVFTSYEPIMVGTQPLDLNYGSRCDIADWNEDGLPDIIASDNNGNVNIFLADIVGIAGETSALISSGLTISPAENPASGSFSFMVSGLETEAEVTLFDGAGRRVLSAGVSDPLVTFGTVNLPAGLYTAVIKQGAEVSSCRVVLVE